MPTIPEYLQQINADPVSPEVLAVLKPHDGGCGVRTLVAVLEWLWDRSLGMLEETFGFGAETREC